MTFACTKETPWAENQPTPVCHVDAYEVGDQRAGWPGGDWVTYECPNCGKRWEAELPQ
jgi:predicted RNA-binding Zn-ribbon protein involved in translation (DUF1610 family)